MSIGEAALTIRIGSSRACSSRTAARWLCCCRSFEVVAHSHFDQQHAGKQRHPNHHPPGVKNADVLAHYSKDQREEHKGDRGEGTHPGCRSRSHPFCFLFKKAHFFTLPLPFTTSLRNSWMVGEDHAVDSSLSS